MNKISKIKRVKIINKFVKITQSGGELGKLNNSFFKLLFLVIFFNLLSFASFGVNCSFDSSTGTLTASGGGELSQTNVTNAVTSNKKSITDIKKVTIKSGITSIGEKAFYRCTSLSSVTIPKSVESIGDNAFHFCSKLRDITIPEGVTSIGDNAFLMCGWLGNITIPSSVISIGNQVFGSCVFLTAINVDEGNLNYKGVNGVLFTKDGKQLIWYPSYKNSESYTIPDGVETIGDYAFGGARLLASVTIPKSVTEIGSYAFRSCQKLSSVTFVEGSELTSIGHKAFSENKVLSSITIPEGVTTIGERAFYNCESLSSVTIPEGVTNIGKETFLWCIALTNVTIPSSVTEIGYAAFSNCNSLATVTFEGDSKLTSINGSAFDGCTLLRDITIPKGVTSIGSTVFQYCKSLKNITIPKGVTTIPYQAFYGCNQLETVTFAEGSELKSIGYTSFNSCTSLNNIIIPNKVTDIDGYAFANCTSLSSITIPKSVTEIGYGAFYECSKLMTDGDVYYLGAEREWSSIAIDEDNDALRNAKRIHCVEELTVNKVWKDVNNKSRKKPELVLYRVYEGAKKNNKDDDSYIKDGVDTPIKLGEGDYVKKEEGKETYTVYKKMRTGTSTGEGDEYTQGNFQYDVDGNGNYKDVKFDKDTGKVDDDGGKKEWQCKFPITDHIIGNKYAVGEKRMKGYTSDAYVD